MEGHTLYETTGPGKGETDGSEETRTFAEWYRSVLWKLDLDYRRVSEDPETGDVCVVFDALDAEDASRLTSHAIGSAAAVAHDVGELPSRLIIEFVGLLDSGRVQCHVLDDWVPESFVADPTGIDAETVEESALLEKVETTQRIVNKSAAGQGGGEL